MYVFSHYYDVNSPLSPAKTLFFFNNSRQSTLNLNLLKFWNSFNILRTKHRGYTKGQETIAFANFTVKTGHEIDWKIHE